MKSFSTLIKRITAKPLNTGMFIIMLMLSLGLSTAQAKDRINYFHSDISGSPIAATNDSGEVLWEETYKPYGERLDNTPSANKDQNNQWFTGKREEADLGLQYFGARWYHQASGRFISRDPAAVMDHVESNPMMFNRYAYANNNPYRYVDPDGRIPVDTIWDAGNIIYDVGKIAVGWGTGNAAMVASGTTDLALDAAAFIVPYVPAGLTKIGGTAKNVDISRAKYGDAAEHIADAQNAGHSDILTIARDGAKANRKASIGGLPKVPGKQLDEYPPAMFKEGGAGASVRAISPKNNMGAGACIGNSCRGLSNGDKVRIRVVD